MFQDVPPQKEWQVRKSSSKQQSAVPTPPARNNTEHSGSAVQDARVQITNSKQRRNLGPPEMRNCPPVPAKHPMWQIATVSRPKSDLPKRHNQMNQVAPPIRGRRGAPPQLA